MAWDQCHLYPQDIGILKSLNQKSYRFSISWPRIQPTGVGTAKQKGLDHYSRLVDARLKAGIRPFCTLYHWDLPQALAEAAAGPTATWLASSPTTREFWQRISATVLNGSNSRLTEGRRLAA